MKNVRLVGAHASPYSRKMRAVLRYRRIPFRWIARGGPDDVDVPPVPVALVPVLAWSGPEGEAAMIDSTFQIGRLEEAVPTRSIVPANPATAFLDALVEDYADEWLTKVMFHYRWTYAPDATKASRVIPFDQNPMLPAGQLEGGAAAFAERQIARLAVVGSTPATAPVIEASYRRLLATLDAIFERAPFLFGTRPSAADFALFGQLSQLVAFDPTPTAIAAEVAPRVIAWVHHVDDLGSLPDPGPDGWRPDAIVAAALRPLLAEIGRVYAPFLLANAAALTARSELVTCSIDGAPWAQAPFPYQGKCLRWLRERYGALPPADRSEVDAALAGTGCEALFTMQA